MRVILSRLLTISLVMGLLFAINPSTANAAWAQYLSSPVDTYNRPELPVAYDITQVDFGITDTDSSVYRFFLDFAKPITGNLFADGLGSWAGIFLDINNDGKDDYSLETPTTPYSSNTFQDGKFVDRTGASAVTSTRCSVRTFTSLDTQASWIGFNIPKACIPFGTTLSIQGFADHKVSDNAEYDFAPTSYWTINLSGGMRVASRLALRHCSARSAAPRSAWSCLHPAPPQRRREP